jgi:hypothetical protein
MAILIILVAAVIVLAVIGALADAMGVDSRDQIEDTHRGVSIHESL